MSTWAIIAIVIAVLAGVLLIGFLLWWVFSSGDDNSNFRLERTISDKDVRDGDQERQYNANLYAQRAETERLRNEVASLRTYNKTLDRTLHQRNTEKHTLEKRLEYTEDELEITQHQFNRLLAEANKREVNRTRG